MIRKISILSLCIVIVIGSFTSCFKGGKDPEKGNDTTVSNDTGVKTERLTPNIPEGTDFGGYTFTILSRGTGSSWISEDIDSQSISGDAIGDAVYKRNRKIEQDLNIEIVEFPIESSSNAEQFRITVNAAQSQDEVYDLLCVGVKDNLAGLVSRGLLADLNDVPYMDLTRSYYDQSSIRDLSIKNKLFFVMGDMLTMDNDATRCFSFNKTLSVDIGIKEKYGKDIYSIVSDGEWTLDVMHEMAIMAARDVNGNNVMEPLEDIWGLITEPYNSLTMLNASGGRLVSKDSDDIPYYSANNEFAINVLQKIIPIQSDKSCVMLSSTVTGYTGSVWSNLFHPAFQDNRVLFYNGQLINAKMFRKYDVDFGIIPLPKYEASQKTYYSPVTTFGSNCIAMPLLSSDFERTGIIVEALSCESKYVVQPAYYDVVIKGKTLKDEQSISMLDIIFENRIYDIGYTFNWGGSYSAIVSLTTNNQAGNVASMLSGIDKATQAAINETVIKISD